MNRSRRGILVAGVLTLVMIFHHNANFQDSSFFVEYYKTQRGASGKIYALINVGQALGSISNCLFSILLKPSLIQRFNIQLPSLKKTHIICQVSMLMWCVTMSITPQIEDVNILLIVVFTLKFMIGMIHYSYVTNTVNCIDAWFPGKWFLVNSIVIGVGQSLGQSTGAYIGSLVFVRWGFNAAYWFCAECIFFTATLCYFVLPESDDQALFPTEEEEWKRHDEEAIALMDEKPEKETVLLGCCSKPKEERLTPLLLLLIFSLVIIQAVPGYTFISLIPYLRECCSLELTHAASYLLFFFMATGLGYFIAGYIAQVRFMRLHTLSLLGALFLTVSLLTTYPLPSLHNWYINSKYIAYLSLFLIAMGDPLLTSNNKKHMEELQELIRQTPPSAAQKEFFGHVWTICLVSSYHVGGFIGGYLNSVFYYHESAWIMAALPFSVVLIMVFLMALEKAAQSSTKK